MRNFFFLLICIVTACGTGTGENSGQDSLAGTTPEIVITTGSVTTLSCKLNVANSYEIYLPQSHSDSSLYPVLVFFSPDGKGKTPVEKYRTLADKWNFILVGSDYTKNGMDANAALAGANELVTDVKNRFNVDGARVYLSGFSGGARVAGGLALSRMDITGVICCSASPPASVSPRGYVGIAGLGDMNYLEMKKFRASTQADAGLNELLVFDGKHEWPPVGTMENAMLMISLFQPGQAASGDMNQMSDSLTSNILAECDSLKRISCMLEFQLLESGIHAEKNYSGVAAFEERRKKLEGSSCVKNEEKHWAEIESQESDLQKVLSESVLSHDTTWWRANSDSYFETKKTGAEKFMRQRLRGYVSLLCYTYCNQAFSMKNMHAAEKLVKVYSIVDPTNSEWAYLQARLYMGLNMTDFAISSMDTAVSLGFNDRQRVERDPTFAPVLSNPAFTVVLAKMN
ncbi:MAG TPA: hypothetical protein VK826_17365 [Bacteroidia bacterium]|nr:hypothetical protein [Bacteroidia bacterium]